jgi:uncharacterized membrane protein
MNHTAQQELRRIIRRPRLLTSSALAVLLFFVLLPNMQPVRAMLVAFDVGAALFLLLMAVLMTRATPQTMHRRARVQDEGKWTVLLISMGVATVVLVALSHELHGAKDKSLTDIGLAVGTILTSWLYMASIFSQHYAHAYYLEPGQLAFPGTEQPDYWDFVYFATVLSMCCQTSDVAVTSSAMRRLVTLQSLMSFFFNVIIIAITVNVVAGVL